MMIDVISPYLVLRQFTQRNVASVALVVAAALGFGLWLMILIDSAAMAFLFGFVIGPLVTALLLQLAHRSMNTAALARGCRAELDEVKAQMAQLRMEMDRGEYSYRALELALLSEERAPPRAADGDR